jgi:hypothetical protein
MNNSPALCELAAMAPKVSAGHMLKHAWLKNSRVIILAFYLHALI